MLYTLNSKQWDTPGLVVEETTPRSYDIQTYSGVSVQRNRQHIRTVPVSVQRTSQTYSLEVNKQIVKKWSNSLTIYTVKCYFMYINYDWRILHTDC